MSTDDWEPLPPNEFCAHPGEAVDLRKRALAATVATTASVPTVAPPKASSPPVDSAQTERGLAELRAKIAQHEPSASLIATVQRDVLRKERKQRAAKAAELVATVVSVAGPAPVVVVDEQTCNLDGRELEPWFKDLPAEEQLRLRNQWAQTRLRGTDGWLRLHRRLGRALCHGALVFTFMGLFQALLLGGFGLVPVLAAVGAIAAGLAELARGDRFVYALAGGLGYVVVMGPVVLIQPFALCSLLFAAYGMGAIGMEGEMRRSAGYNDC